MQKHTIRMFWGLLIAMLLPVMAMAAPPPPASGITATVEDGTVRVAWEPIEDQAKARIYWSYISILDNGGEYDDYAVAEGPATEYVIEQPPPVDTLYVSVILENSDGEQSPFFTEEASVSLGSAQESSDEAEASSSFEPELPVASSIASMSASSSPFVPASFASDAFAASSAAPQDGNFHLLSAESMSPTQVLLMFSHPVTIRPEDAGRAFAITTPDGRILPLLKLEILGGRVTIATDTQERGVPYVATATSVVGGMDGQIVIPLANPTETATFTGNAFGKDPVQPTPMQNGFILQATPMGGNLFRVESMLSGLPNEGVARYDIYQSIDGGRTFMGPQPVDPRTPSIRVDGVVAGAFVMVLQPIGMDGQPGSPLTATLMLGQGTMPPPTSSMPMQPIPQPQPQPLPQKPVPSPALPGAGAGIVTLLGAGSAWTMMRRMRRKAGRSIAA